MDQAITGAAGLNESAMGDGSRAHIIQQLITGNAGIGSGEQFSRKSGVHIDPLTVPVAIWISY